MDKEVSFFLCPVYARALRFTGGVSVRHHSALASRRCFPGQRGFFFSVQFFSLPLCPIFFSFPCPGRFFFSIFLFPRGVCFSPKVCLIFFLIFLPREVCVCFFRCSIQGGAFFSQVSFFHLIRSFFLNNFSVPLCVCLQITHIHHC